MKEFPRQRKSSTTASFETETPPSKLTKFVDWANNSNFEIWALVLIISLESVLIFRSRNRAIEAGASIALTWLLLRSKQAQEAEKGMRRKRSEDLREKQEVDYFFQDPLIFKEYILGSIIYTVIHFCFLGFPSPVSLMHLSISILTLLLNRLAIKMEEIIFLGWILGDCLSYLNTVLPFIESTHVFPLPPALKSTRLPGHVNTPLGDSTLAVVPSKKIDEMVFFLFELFVPSILLGSGLHYYAYYHQKLSLQFALIKTRLGRLMRRKHKKEIPADLSGGEEAKDTPNSGAPSGIGLATHSGISSGDESAAEEEAWAIQEEERLKNFHTSRLEAKDIIKGMLGILCIVHLIVGGWFLKIHFDELSEMVTAAVPWGVLGVVMVLSISIVAYIARVYQLLPITITRKLFHLLAIIIFVPGMEHHPKLLSILFAWAVTLFVMVEVLRVAFKVYHLYPRLVQASEQFLKGFNDGKDEKFILTHTYLLLGCIYPMLSTIIRERTWSLMSGGEQTPYSFDRLKGVFSVSGLAVVGVADAFASVIGKSLGKHRIGHLKKSVEGTAAFVISACLFLLLIGKSESIWCEFICFTFMAAIELFSGLVDNLVLPTLCLATFRLLASLSFL